MPGLQVERVGEGYPWVLERGDVGKECSCVEVHRVTARRSQDGHVLGEELLGEVLDGPDAIVQVGLVHDLFETSGDGLEVVAGEAAVGRKSLGQDQQRPGLLGPGIVVHGEEATDVGEAVLLGRHGAPVGETEDLLGDGFGGAFLLSGLAGLDEPGILREAAGVEEEGLLEAVTECTDSAEVLQGDRLSTARVVGDGDHDQGDAVAFGGEELLECHQVHVAFEGVDEGRNAPLGDDQVSGLGSLHLDVGAGGVEVGVARDDVTPLEHRVEEDAFGGPSLVGGDDVAKAREVCNDVAEAVERAASGVRLVPLHESAPLGRRHGAGARVGEQVDENVLRGQEEEVEPRRAKRCLTLLPSRELHRLDGLDAKRLDDGSEVHVLGPPCTAIIPRGREK